MSLGVKQLRPHNSYFVALNSLKLSLLSVDVSLTVTHLNIKGKLSSAKTTIQTTDRLD